MTTPQMDNQCDAIVFIPGTVVVDELIDQSIDGIAQRIAIALKRNASISAQFRIESQEYNPESSQVISTENSSFSKAQVIRISREDNVSGATIDVYKLNYNDSFMLNYKNKNLFLKVLRLFLLLIYGIPVLVSSLFSRNRAKNSLEKLQLLLGVLWFSLFVIYMGVLLTAVFGTVTAQVESSYTITIPQAIIVLITLLESFLPNIRQFSEKIIINYICLLEYLSFGERRNVISGQLTDLLEYLGKKGIYHRVHIISYSFGTVIALDNLFPFNGILNKRSQIVDTLITIACPFDIIRLFWQDYFNQRQMLPQKVPSWINLYNPIDILSSNFRDDAQLGEAQVGICFANSDTNIKPAENIAYIEGINTKKPSPTNLLILLGIRSHFTYWRRKHENEENCFSILIAALYKDNGIVGE
jgi:uncharacterized protein YhhL (DUF1145 family)